MTATHKLPVPFAEGKRASEFERALLSKILKRVNELREEIIPPENVSAMPHGHGWTFQQQREEGFVHETGEFKRQSTEISIHDSQILSHEIASIEAFIVELSDKMQDQFMSSLIHEIEVTTERFGRVTNIKENESLAEGLLATLANIQASVDSEGNVTLPTLMLNSETLERLRTELANSGNEFEQKANKIKEQAKQDALIRETDRLAKYDQQ